MPFRHKTTNNLDEYVCLRKLEDELVRILEEDDDDLEKELENRLSSTCDELMECKAREAIEVGVSEI